MVKKQDKNKADLELELSKLRRQLDDICVAEAKQENSAYAGKFFRIRNCFSDGETWWLYRHVTGLTPYGELECWDFEKDMYGDMRFSRTKDISSHSNKTWIAISKKEFYGQYKKLLDELSKRNPNK